MPQAGERKSNIVGQSRGDACVYPIVSTLDTEVADEENGGEEIGDMDRISMYSSSSLGRKRRMQDVRSTFRDHNLPDLLSDNCGHAACVFLRKT
jgi:hypothetical protein